MHFWKHFVTITKHRWLVRKGCFAVGLYWQGLTHDLSKYSLTEFIPGAKYYQGFRSPNNKQRELYDYSSAWLHHKGRNRHHYEYWTDYGLSRGVSGESIIVGKEMPIRFVVEMVMDRIAASKTYMGAEYDDTQPLKYYEKGTGRMGETIHPNTQKILHQLLELLAMYGEEKTFQYIKQEVIPEAKKNGTYNVKV
ncbi:MAG: DUF5662 family protein [Lachnospiraceae bacterium]|jgi:hypothetical protein|nr:DUF5662 family protein [Lachnospiraceae bacterium]